MKQRGGFWHALPREAARWWKGRSTAPDHSKISICEGMISITPSF
jgi:hypothetical protein